MASYEITPRVDETQEFIEIANDFSNPLDLVREAVSNSYDARATLIEINFDVVKKYGERVLVITLRDNGEGMSEDELQAFFDLGNSTKRDDVGAIGEKGHGAKVYFNCDRLTVETSNGDFSGYATMESPFRRLHERVIPKVSVERKSAETNGTKIVIEGYNNSRREKFTHEMLKDHIMWFTKHGAVENVFDSTLREVTLRLKGLERESYEEIPQGHPFPSESDDINTLFERHLTQAPHFFSKRIVRQGRLPSFPEIGYDAVFSIEGKNVKYSYNPMIRRPGYKAPTGAYTIQERYGLWLCKDYMPVQRKNEWITFKGSEFTKFHAFINCQDLRLTANRSSVENTPYEILSDLEQVVKSLFDEIVESDEWTSMEWLEEEAAAYQTKEKEKKNFQWRVKKVNRAKVADYKGVRLVEPERESGVYSLFLIISLLEPQLFPFSVVDYDTHEGIDVIAKSDHDTPMQSAKMFYVEFKRTLTGVFNHSFSNLHSIVCWDTDLEHDRTLSDINNEERRMVVMQPQTEGDYTKYYLDNPRKAHKIEVFVLKSYLREKLGIEFTARTADAKI